MSNLPKSILFQYFSGNASPLQRKMIQGWLEDDANIEIFYQCLEEWENEHVQFKPNTDLAAKDTLNITLKVQHKNTEAAVVFVEHPKYLIMKKYRVALIAASLLILFFSYFVFRFDINNRTYKTGYGEIKEFALTDGSNVILNANSILIVPRLKFNKGDRHVELTGEAAFNVKHSKSDQKFLVNTKGKLNVEVLGTEFSVYSRNNNNKVALRKGSIKIRFKQREYEPLIMKPGDVLSVNITGKVMVKHQQPEHHFIAWKDHRFVYDSTSLADAVHSIHEFFGIKIIIRDNSLKEKSITGSFKAESPQELLRILAEMYNITLLERADSLILQEK